MKCKDFENMIHELASRRGADTTRQLEALDHAGQCLACARRLDEENKLTERLLAFAHSLEGQLAPLRVEAELLQAFRERRAKERGSLLGTAWRRFGRKLEWGLAFAAVVAAAWAVVVLWPRLHRSASAAPSRVAASGRQARPDALRATPAPEASVTVAAAKTVPKTQVAHARYSQPSLPDESAGETTTDFLSLGTCDDSQCMEEATLVRVALPAEALLAFGLGMNDEYAPEALVQADVALGSDGVPFAIRFVN